MDFTYAVNDWVFGQTHTGGLYCNFITSKPLGNGAILRKYASSVIKHITDNILINNAVPYKINKIQINGGTQREFTFSNVPIYNVNPIADSNISTWELHSDDGSGHFIVKVYRELGYIELDVIEELNFLC